MQSLINWAYKLAMIYLLILTLPIIFFLGNNQSFDFALIFSIILLWISAYAIQNPKKWRLPLGIISVFLLILFSTILQFHFKESPLAWQHIPVFVILLVLLLLIKYENIKKEIRQQEQSSPTI